jgi:hypothetical protein
MGSNGRQESREVLKVYTPYSYRNQGFTDAAHDAAQSLVYPTIFDCDKSLLSFETSSVADGGEKAILDGQMAVDRIVSVTVSGLKGPIEHMVQERFRRPDYARFRDITITEWNHASNQKSELYKLKAGIFLYGYFDNKSGLFGEVIAANTAAVLMAISNETLRYTRETNPRTKQSFICVTFDALQDAGVVLWHGFPSAGGTDGR